MPENICEFLFEYEDSLVCVLGNDCTSKTPQERISCKNVALFFNRGITAAEIRQRKIQVIQKLRTPKKK
jgi:hypothetical protein